MTPEEKRATPRVIFTAQLRITYETPGQFEHQFAGNISTGGIFIQTKNPKPVGTPLKLQVLLRDGRTLLEAEGVVTWNRQQTPGRSGDVSGMGIRFKNLSDQSRQLVEKIVSRNSPHSEFEKNLLDQALKDGPERATPSGQPGSPATSTSNEEIVLGIDLGTTFTCCGFVENGKPKIIPSEKGYYVIPSVVGYYEKKQDIIVGHAAVDQIITNPEGTAYGFKRMLGRNFHSPFVEQCREYFTYPMQEGPNSEILVELGPKRYTLTDLSSLILKEIHEVAQGTLQKKIAKAVISVPAYYNEQQRQAVREAGEKAGLKVLKIVNEPTAAALAYGFNRGLQQTILVFDLGGGTFDVSILRITGNVFETLATSGDNFLGGLDFDKAIMEHMMNNFEKETGIDLTGSPICLQRVRNAAEKMKIDLSSQEETSIHLPFIAEKEGKPVDLRANLSRNLLNRLTQTLVDKALIIVEKVLSDVKMDRKSIDSILLVGGQTRMPLIAKKIEEFFGRPPNKGVHPDEVVALGASLYGYSLNQMESVLLKDVVSIPIGVGLPGGKFKAIIEKNSPIPTLHRFSISTVTTNQTSINIDIFQGDSVNLTQNEYLGSFQFEGLPAAPKGEVKLTLQFELNEESILTVAATHEASGKSLAKRIITKDTPQTLKEALAASAKKDEKGLLSRLFSSADKPAPKGG